MPVAYGDGQLERIREAAPRGTVSAFVDTFGGGYCDLAIELGVAPARINTIADFGAIERLGVQGQGTHSRPRRASSETPRAARGWAAAGELEVPIARTYPLAQVRDAFPTSPSATATARSSCCPERRCESHGDGPWTARRLDQPPRDRRRQLGAAAATAEELGYGAIWLGGSPRLPAVRPMLEATERLIVATGIVNIWAYDPAQLAAEYAELEPEFPGRLLVGIGIGHPEATSDYARPLATTRAFLDGLDRAATPLPGERRAIAALGPKMLELSAQRTLGTHPYFVPVAHSALARAAVGPEKLVAPELACVLDEDAGRARATARGYAATYLGLTNYTRNLLNCGFTEDDFARGGSDALIDAVIPQGSPAAIAAVARAHIRAGADHVCLQTIGVEGVPRAEWAALAAAFDQS